MLVQIVTENGQKKVIPLTADAGAGLPVGFIAPAYKKGNYSGWLYLDGRDTTGTSEELSTHYPILYAILGSNVLPDYREFALVGAEENTTDVYNASTNPNGTIHDHDVYTQGQAKDDQLQAHTHALQGEDQVNGAYSGNTGWKVVTAGALENGGLVLSNTTQENNGRKGAVTRGKRKAVYFYIKATSGLSENAQDNVVAQLNEQRSYSTEEHFTGKYWYNGKKIYEKVITGLALSGVKTDLTNTGITITNLEEITNSISYRANPNGIISGNSYFVSEGGAILYLSQSGQAISKISFEYTKTTD